MGQWNVIAAYLLDGKFGFQAANLQRENLIALAACRFPHQLGGSDDVGTLSASYVNPRNYLPVWIDGTELVGLTCHARVDVRTANVATSVQPRIFNVTDTSVAIEGAAFNSDLNRDPQILTFTPLTGLNEYRLEIKGGNATNVIFGLGQIQLFATA